jgi:hypothetical protein
VSKKPSITPPEYSRGLRISAKEMKCPLFTLDVDGTHLVRGNKGQRRTTQGILIPEWATAAGFFQKAINMLPTGDATERDFEAKPYSPDEARVAEYLFELTQGNVGAGDDPIGFLIASHRMLRALKDQGESQ